MTSKLMKNFRDIPKPDSCANCIHVLRKYFNTCLYCGKGYDRIYSVEADPSAPKLFDIITEWEDTHTVYNNTICDEWKGKE